MNMKNKLFLATAILAFAACSENTYMGDQEGNVTGSGAITFGFDMQNGTRGEDLVGETAATTLQKQFIVYGTKHASNEDKTATNDEVVFQNYKVEYSENTAGHTTSNTSNWEYVGLTPYANTQVTPVATSTYQTIKYWDYSAAQGYTFYGIAAKDNLNHTTGDVLDPLVTINKTTTATGDGATVYDKGYSVVIKNDADLDKLFIADRKHVEKAKFNEPVTLTFRNFGAHVRVGFYETIPGYSVKIDNFYTDGDANAAVTTFGAMDTKNTTKFAASLQNISTTAESNTLTITYYNGTNGPENQVKVTPTTTDYNYSLVLGTNVISATALGNSSTSPTWDKTDGTYTTVYPFEANSNPMLIKVDYTLTSEDGSNETIKVIGATAVVPTQYVQWKSNFAYTYIFKIAPNTNGKTDPSAPEGLYPITFDAVVVNVADDKTQETITTFEQYSLTSYSNGSKVTVDNEYKKGNDIYVVKTQESNGAIVAQTIGTTAVNYAQVYKVTQDTGADAISEASITAKLNDAPNGIVLTATTGTAEAALASSAPAADGTTYEFGTGGAVKFKPADAGTYAYVSVRTVNVKAEYTAVGSADYDNTQTYYFKTSQNVYYAASGINADNFSTYQASLYTRNASPTLVAGEYDIKIIKVVD